MENFSNIQSVEGIIFERHGYALPEVNWKLFTIITLVELLILSAVEYGITDFIIKVKRREIESESLKDIALYGLRNVGWAFLLMIIEFLYMGAIILVGSLPFIIILILASFLTPLVPLAMILLILWILMIAPFSLAVSTLILPRFVDTRSLREAISVIKYGRRYKASMFGFGLLLILAGFVFLITIGIIEMSIYLFSTSLLGRVLASLLTVPFMALLSLFTTIAGAVFYENIRVDYERRREILNWLISSG